MTPTVPQDMTGKEPPIVRSSKNVATGRAATSLFGVATLLVGAMVFAYSLANLISGPVLDPAATAPGAMTFPASGEGRWYIWDHHRTSFEGEQRKYDSRWPSEAEITIRDAQGAVLEWTPDSSRSWSIGNHAKTSVGYVEVPAATSLTLEVRGLPEERVLSVSNRSMGDELWARLGGIGGGLIIGLFGIVVTLVGLLSRRKRRPQTGRT